MSRIVTSVTYFRGLTGYPFYTSAVIPPTTYDRDGLNMLESGVIWRTPGIPS